MCIFAKVLENYKMKRQVFANAVTKIEPWFSASVFVVMLILSVFSAVDILAFYIERDFSWALGVGLAGFIVLKATLLTILYDFLKKWRWLLILYQCFLGFYGILCLINFVAWLLYGYGISRRLALIAFNTNSKEISEFISVFRVDLLAKMVSWKALGWLLVSAIIWKLILMVPKRILLSGLLTCSVIGTLYISYYFVGFTWGKLNHSITLRTLAYCRSAYNSLVKIKELNDIERTLPMPETVVSRHSATNVIFVIGESASQSHWSLYGYGLTTTPIVDSRAGELVVLSDVVTSSTSTAESIVCLLTTMSDEPCDKEWYEFPTVFQIMKEAGYKTYWASNQEYTGFWSNMSGVLSGDADEIEYVGSVHSEDHLTDRYDEALLPVVRDYLAQSDSLKIVGVHLMGSHTDYVKRYPQEQTMFTGDDILETMPRPWLNKEKARIVAEYDNSIHYTDSVLGEMLNYVKENPDPSVLIYVSDHGENVYDNKDFRGRDEMARRVPMFIYMNDSYKAGNEDVVSQLEITKDLPYSTAGLIHLIMGMTGTEYALRDESADISSAEYRVRPRYVDDEIFKDDDGKQYE